jgi:hypothetical protein
MQTVIVARLVGSANLILQDVDNRFGIRYLGFFHEPTVSQLAFVRN